MSLDLFYFQALNTPRPYLLPTEPGSRATQQRLMTEGQLPHATVAPKRINISHLATSNHFLEILPIFKNVYNVNIVINPELSN